MSSAATGRFRRRRRDTWQSDDTVVVDMRAFLREQLEATTPTQSDATVVQLSPAPGPPPLPDRPLKPPPRPSLEARECREALARTLRRQLESSERARQELLVECRKLRVELKKRRRDTKDSLARARMQGTIDHLRRQLERAEVAMTREKARSSEIEKALQEMVDESMRTIERLTNKVAHLERERGRALDRLDDLEMDRAGKAMQITHLEMALTERNR